jgi:hypothetical protein
LNHRVSHFAPSIIPDLAGTAGVTGNQIVALENVGGLDLDSKYSLEHEAVLKTCVREGGIGIACIGLILVNGRVLARLWPFFTPLPKSVCSSDS